MGPRSSFVLWDQLLGLLADTVPEDELADCSVLLAGGIHDARSAAAAAAVGAPLASRGVNLGVLCGTAYLFTEEAVGTGAIMPGFQQAALACDGTALLETGPGHATRCARTTYADDFATARQGLVAAGVDERDVFDSLEELNLGRLRIAAKGLRREGPELVNVADEEQRRTGMFMLGQVAALRVGDDHDRGVARRADHRWPAAARRGRPGPGSRPQARGAAASSGGHHRHVAACCLGQPTWGDTGPTSSRESTRSTRCPPIGGTGAPTTTPIRRHRDRVPSRWGGFMDPVLFDPLEYGIPPRSLPSIEPLQLLTLHAVRAALTDAGYERRPLPRQRVSVILGVGGGIADLGQQYAVRSGLPQVLDEVPADVLGRLPEWTEDSFAGILLNVAAGRVANRFDFGGSNFIVDAACASSLAALHLGARELAAGSSDVVLVGGADTVQNPFGYLCFAATQALSPRGRCRTFDASADGIVISEGVAVVVLKRLEDAERDGDRVYAVLDGTAGASDGRALGLTAPRVEGQRLAIERACAAAGISPGDIGLVEAHGTGTTLGDDTELRTLDEVFAGSGARPGGTVVGSVKSMIGHTKCAAGLAGVIKAALALHHRVLPPTLHVQSPNPRLDRPDSPFRLAVRPRPWLDPPGGTRRAAVSSFGFGGTNFHAVLSEHDDRWIAGERATVGAWPAELLLWTAADRGSLRAAVDRVDDALAAGAEPVLRDLAASTCERARVGSDDAVLAVVAESLADLRIKLGLARAALDSGTTTVEDDRGVYLGTRPVGGRVAFLFPGQGSQYPGMLEELAVYFPEVGERWNVADRTLSGGARHRLSDLVLAPPSFTPDQERARARAVTETAVAQPALGAAGLGAYRLLEALGVAPDLLAGHSYGELVALAAAGSLDEEALLRVSEARGRAMAEACPQGEGTMAAVAAGPDEVEAALDGMADVWSANLNSPRQTVISGRTDAVTRAVSRLADAGLDATPLPVSAAFHSPLMAAAARPLADALEAEEVRAPLSRVYSGVTADLHEGPDDIRANLVRQVTDPVRFADVVEALHADGARVFVECGPRSVLTGLVGQTMGERPHVAVALDGEPGLVGFLQRARASRRQRSAPPTRPALPRPRSTAPATGAAGARHRGAASLTDQLVGVGRALATRARAARVAADPAEHVQPDAGRADRCCAGHPRPHHPRDTRRTTHDRATGPRRRPDHDRAPAPDDPVRRRAGTGDARLSARRGTGRTRGRLDATAARPTAGACFAGAARTGAVGARGSGPRAGGRAGPGGAGTQPGTHQRLAPRPRPHRPGEPGSSAGGDRGRPDRLPARRRGAGHRSPGRAGDRLDQEGGDPRPLPAQVRPRCRRSSLRDAGALRCEDGAPGGRRTGHPARRR